MSVTNGEFQRVIDQLRRSTGEFEPSSGMIPKTVSDQGSERPAISAADRATTNGRHALKRKARSSELEPRENEQLS